jgi:hypothetical protein
VYVIAYRPNNALQPTPLRVEHDRGDFDCWLAINLFPTYDRRRG